MLKFTTPLTTRCAPSPTGNAHMGLVRTAYINWLAAKSTGGKFILRIDDTDKERSKQEYVDNILDTLKWLGLDYDEIVYQSSRLERHKEAAKDLLAKGCAVRKDKAIFIHLGEYMRIWNDIIGGRMVLGDDKLEIIKQLVLVRSDGNPTYHFSSVVDDIDMNVNCIIRGTDHIENTGKHIQIYRAMRKQFSVPHFAHVGLIHFQGKKISKRDGIFDMDSYRKYNPEAILNCVLKLGWSHPSPTLDKDYPLINKETAVKLFQEGYLKAASSTLDINKLSWLNKKYNNLVKSQ